MPTWSDLQDDLNSIDPKKRGNRTVDNLRDSANAIAKRYRRNVLHYASGFLPTPEVPGFFTTIHKDDINGSWPGFTVMIPTAVFSRSSLRGFLGPGAEIGRAHV